MNENINIKVHKYNFKNESSTKINGGGFRQKESYDW
jgi:hypothetical protein